MFKHSPVKKMFETLLCSSNFIFTTLIWRPNIKLVKMIQNEVFCINKRYAEGWSEELGHGTQAFSPPVSPHVIRIGDLKLWPGHAA